MSQIPAGADAPNPANTDRTVGMTDGLIVSFALTAGLYGARLPFRWIVVAGLAQLVVSGTAMGLGRYFTGREKDDHHDHSEWLGEPADRNEPKALVQDMNLSDDAHQVIHREMARDRQEWSEFVSKFELEEESPGELRRNALRIATGYAVAGLVPVLPYIFLGSERSAFTCSVALTIGFLALVGGMSAREHRRPVWAGALRQMVTGAIAAASTYFIAGLFR